MARYDITEVVHSQSVIISMQSKVINELCETLMQYMTQEELDSLPAIQKINTIASIEGGVGL
jgi:hypothetical protein